MNSHPTDTGRPKKDLFSASKSHEFGIESE